MHPHPEVAAVVKKYFNIPLKNKIILYAPTFRDSIELTGKMDFSVYGIDFERLKMAVERKFGGEWSVIVKWHPFLANYAQSEVGAKGIDCIDATQYNDMQELIIASDIVISDYSSCIFDAALRNIPCFTFATDFEEYKEERGVYYEMEELPFPYAKNNDELESNVMNFDEKTYLDKWESFKNRMGLKETGHAAMDIAKKINEFMETGCVSWDD
jgi:CDP-glycerol glycerophosphotransferase